ncbi:hypothetical protein GIB67_010543 [Kingdonia uniflora]|uniref:Uncharacterized protein n=1 Tax=Kingdonia uniflora TaxID=39325 RepID=A0A7J7MAT9_9MAGN|nr:hypothetical protein GIB67_010543 [Kingdonia uniflora]
MKVFRDLLGLTEEDFIVAESSTQAATIRISWLQEFFWRKLRSHGFIPISRNYLMFQNLAHVKAKSTIPCGDQRKMLGLMLKCFKRFVKLSMTTPSMIIEEDADVTLVSLFIGLLRCPDCVIPYLPGRCTRQLGRVQGVLENPPFTPVVLLGISVNKHYKEREYVADLQNCRNELERLKQILVEKENKLKVARENLSALEVVVEHLHVALPVKDMKFREMQRRCNDHNERVARLKVELAQANACAKKAEAGERSRRGGKDVQIPLVRGDVVSLSGRIRELSGDVARIQGHVQRGNASLKECQ